MSYIDKIKKGQTEYDIYAKRAKETLDGTDIAEAIAEATKVKTIVLPVSSETGEMSIEEYKQSTGIDLGEYLYFNDDGDICFDAKGTCFYIKALDNLCGGLLQYGLIRSCFPVTNASKHSDSVYKYLRIGTYMADENAVTGLEFLININAEPMIDNIAIRLCAM